MSVLGCGAEVSKLMDVSDKDYVRIERGISNWLKKGVSQSKAQLKAVDEALAQLAEERTMVMRAIDEQLGKAPANEPIEQKVQEEPATQEEQKQSMPSFTVDAVRQAIGKRYSKVLQGLESKGLVTLAQSEEDAIESAAKARVAQDGGDVEEIKQSLMSAAGLDIKRSSDGRIQGFYDPNTKKSFLVADALNEKTATGVLMHEVGIHMAADGSMEPMFKRAEQLIKDGQGDVFFDRIRNRLEDAGETSGEEAAAYLVEEYINNEEAIPKSVMDWMTSLYATIRAWMYRHGIIITGESLSAADIAAVAKANAKSLSESAEAKGSGFDLLNSSDSPETRALRELSKIDDMFLYAKSDKTDMAGIIADNNPMIEFKKSSFGNETLYKLTIPNVKGNAKIWVRSPSPYGPSVYSQDLIDGELKNVVTERPGDNPEDVPPDTEDVYVDVSDLKEGDYGALIYNIAATYAHNTGRIFIGDPNGLSDVAMRRRLENMISTAVKFGTTDHIAPHPRQVSGDASIGVKPLQWVYGDSVGNLKRMVDVSLQSSKNSGQEELRYEPDTGNFTHVAPGGEVLAGESGASAERLSGVSGSHRKGWRTDARAAIFRALLREEGQGSSGQGGRDGLLERFLSLGNQRHDTTRQIFYSRGSSGKVPGTGSVSQKPNGWEIKDRSLDAFLQKFQDGRIDLKRAQEAITEYTGKEIQETADARLAETLYAGRVADRSKSFLEGDVKPLLELMNKQKVDQTELSDYMLARHAPERNAQIAKVNPDMPDGGAGTNSQGVLMTTQAANDYIKNLSVGQRTKLELIAKRVDAITKGTRELLVNEGLESQDAISAWEGAYKFYAPLFKNETETGMYSHPQGSGFTAKGSSSKRAMGSEGEVTNMLAHVFQQREAAITRAEKNRVAMSLYALALDNPNPDFFSVVRPSMKDAAIEAELQKMGVDPSAISGMERAPTIKVIDKSTGKVRNQVNPMYKNLPNAVVLKVGGQDRVILFNTKNERALRLVENLRNLDAPTFDLLNKIGHVTRFMASMATQYNPVFGVANVVRDVQGALVNLSNTPIANKRLKVLANLASAGKGIAADFATNGQSQDEWAKLYRQFRADGGQTGYMDNVRDPFERTKAIAKELENLDRSKVHPARVAHLILGALDGWNTTLENSTRLSVYKAALDAGQSRAKAAKIAREITVDFNRKGSAMKHISPLYAFANASVQGTSRTLETFKDPKRAAAIVSAGLAIGALQALALAAAGYDDDEIQEFEKSRSLIFPIGVDADGKKQYFKVPMPLGLHILPNTGRVATELALSGGKNAAKRVWTGLGEIAGAFNPFGGGDISTLHGVATAIAPTVFDPLIDLATNKNFAGNSISKERMFKDDMRPGHRMAKESTLKQPSGEVYTGISKAINSVTGGNDYRKGTVSMTPEEVRYILMTVGGGLLREIEKGTNTAIKSANGEQVKPNEIPLVGRFYGDVDPDQVQMSRYYENSSKVSKLASELQQLKKGKDSEGITALRGDNPAVSLTRREADVGRSISGINRQIIENIDSPDKVKELEQRRVMIMKSFNEQVKAAEERR